MQQRRRFYEYDILRYPSETSRSRICVAGDPLVIRFTANGPCDLGEEPFLVEWNISCGEGSGPVRTRSVLWIRIGRILYRRCSQSLESRVKNRRITFREPHFKQLHRKTKCSRIDEEEFVWNFLNVPVIEAIISFEESFPIGPCGLATKNRMVAEHTIHRTNTFAAIDAYVASMQLFQFIIWYVAIVKFTLLIQDVLDFNGLIFFGIFYGSKWEKNVV